MVGGGGGCATHGGMALTDVVLTDVVVVEVDDTVGVVVLLTFVVEVVTLAG